MRSQTNALDRVIEFLLYLTISIVPLVYFNNPIATEYFFSKAFFFDFLVYGNIGLFFLRALIRNELTIRWGTTFVALAVFCFICVQSLIGAENFWKGWETIVRVGASIPFMFLMYQEVGTREGVRRFLLVAAITNIAVTAYGFLQYYEVFPLPKDQYGTPDPSTTIGLTNFVMEYMTPFMFVIPAMIVMAKSRVQRTVFVLATIFQFYYFLISDNRASQLGFVSALPLGMFLIWRQYQRGSFRFSAKSIGAAAMVLVVGLGVVGVSPQGKRFIERAASIFAEKKDDAITFRTETWKQSLIIFSEHPIRGVGLSNLEVIFPLYQSPFLEYMTLKKNTRVVRAHNEYIQVIADLGLIGGIVYLWFLIGLVFLGFRAYKRARNWDDMLLITGLLLGLNAYLVVAFFAFPMEVPSSGLSFLFVIGMLEVMTNRVLLPEGEKARSFTLPKSWTGPVTGTALALSVLFWAYTSTYMWHVLRAEVYFKESRVMKDLNQWEVARGLLDDAIRYYPQNEAYYYDRSIFSIRENDIPSALNDLQKTARLVPNYGMGHKQMGLLAAQIGDFKRAAKEFAIAYRIYNQLGNEYIPLLINAYLGYGNTVSAVALADSNLQYKNAEVKLASGQAYIAGKQLEKAITALDVALELKPGYNEARVFKGMALGELGRHQEALDQFEQAEQGGLQGRQQNNALKVGRAKALLALGRAAEAKQVVAATLAADPGSRAMFANDPVLRVNADLQPLFAK